ncbi:mitochondrial-processing peptidase subunit alpha [Ixodes scapularis]
MASGSSRVLPKGVRDFLKGRRTFSRQRTGCAGRRALCTSSAVPPKDEITKISLSKPLPGFPQPVYAVPSPHDQATEVTTLENGLKVASQNKFGQFCTVGVVIDSGSRTHPSNAESKSSASCTGGASTKEFRDRDAVLQELEKQGGICDCQGSRDTMIYAASADARGLGPVVKLLGDVVLRPLFKEEEVERTRQTIQFELEDIDMKPDQEQLLFEMIHAAAYTDNTLGLPKLCPRENLGVVNRRCCTPS